MKAFYFLILLLFTNCTVYSQWSTNPDENLQVAVHGGNIHVVSNGNGGAVLTFNNFDYELVTTYMQAIDKFGYLKWSEPEVIADSPGPKNYSQDIYIYDDGSVLIGYISGYDSLSGIMVYRKYNAYVNKIDSNGSRLWGEHGISVQADTTGRNLDVDYCSDGDGGVFAFCIISYDLNYPPYYLDSLFIQHISKDGVRLWGENGIFIADSIFTGTFWWIIDDDSGGIFIQYGEFIEKYNANGELHWSIAADYPGVIKDGRGGIIISGVIDSYPANKLIINRISSIGDKLWGEGGIIIDDSVNNNLGYPVEIFLNSDTTISVFWDTQWWPNDALFLQRYTLDGTQIWNQHLNVSLYSTNKTRLGMIESDNNSNIVVWSENRDTVGNYMQKIDVTGNKLWNKDKFIGAGTSSFNIITDGNDGAIAVWQKDPPWGGIYAQQISKNGNLGEVITSVNEDDYVNSHPNSFELFQNYPNPFNPSTKISWQSPVGSWQKLKIYDMLGREIATLINEYKPAGKYEINWNAGNLPSGVYIYKIQAGDFVNFKKMILVK
jgi:hypothetical protein